MRKRGSVRGNRKLSPPYGKHEGVKLIGIVNYETGNVYCREEEKYDAEVFLDFLKDILALYPTGKIVMILDNARIHHAKLLKPFLQENENRLQLEFLPPYSPQLNLIEGLWRWLKSSVINNVFFSSVKEMRQYQSSCKPPKWCKI